LDNYFPIEQVDEPALPVKNWEISTEVIAALRLRRLVAQIWIADNGKIRHVEVISSVPPASQEQQQHIKASLMTTLMAPAIRNGRPVSSRRTLEMALEF
jgi:hypothetical protein